MLLKQLVKIEKDRHRETSNIRDNLFYLCNDCQPGLWIGKYMLIASLEFGALIPNPSLPSQIFCYNLHLKLMNGRLDEEEVEFHLILRTGKKLKVLQILLSLVS